MFIPRKLRQKAVADLTGCVLEVGAGAGHNFPYYQAARKVIAVEPDPVRRQKAAQRALATRTPIRVVDALAEHLPFARHSFDAGVLTTVLCSVNDLALSLAELRRVLRPGAPLRLVEHVRSQDAEVAAMQTQLGAFLRRHGRGCYLDRCTVEAVRAAGFEIENLQSHLYGIVVEVSARTPR